MPYNDPYGLGYISPEYNPSGDSYNGYTGSQSAPSIFNANAQRRPSSSTNDPFSGMLEHAMALNAAKRMKPPTAGDAFAAFGAKKINPRPPGSDASLRGGGGGAPVSYSSSMSALMDGGATPGAPLKLGPEDPNLGGATETGGDAAFHHTNVITSTGTHAHASNPNLGVGAGNNPLQGPDLSKSGLDPASQNVLGRWIQADPRYSWLADPKFAWMVPRYFEDMQMRGNDSTDFVDWLQMQMTGNPNIDQSKLAEMNPAYKRSGSDTWNPANNVTVNPTGTGGGTTTTPVAGGGGSIVTTYGANYGTLPTFGGQGGGGTTTTGGGAAAGGNGATTGGGTGTAGGNGTATGGGTGTGTGSGGSGADGGNLGTGPGGGDFISMLKPYFEQQQQELSRQMDAQAAANGDTHSGGYGMNKALAQSNLGNQQSAQIAGLASTAYENEQNRAMQKYGIDTQAKLETAGQDLQKYGIDVNKVMQQYGIDTNDKLQRFLAELDSQTRIKVAQMGDSAASRSAAVQLAAAKVAAQSANYRADLDYKLGSQGQQYNYNLGLGGLDLQNQGQIMNYILGQQGNQSDWYRNLLSLLNGTTPGTVVVKP